MKQPTIHIDSTTFRSRLVPAAAVLYAISALLGLPGCVFLLSSDYRALLSHELFLRGYVEPNVIGSWMWIYGALSVISCVCAAIMAIGLCLVLSKQMLKGFSLLGSAAHYLLYAARGAGVLGVAFYAFRMISSIISYLSNEQGMVYVLPMLLFEGAMGALAWYLFRKLCSFLSCAGDCTASIAYTLSSGTLDSSIFPPLAATGFLALSVFGFYLTLDRTFFITIVNAFPKDYFQLMIVQHPVQLISGTAYLLGSIANLLIYLYLRRFLRIYERMRYETRKFSSR